MSDLGKPEAPADHEATGQKELLPCPFCGCPARLKHPDGLDDNYWITCSDCLCDMGLDCPDNGVYDSAEEATTDWNKRAPPVSPQLPSGMEHEN